MGRFGTTVEFYRFREPYPLSFFLGVVNRLALTRQTRLLDIGCGPGNLAIGFAPYVGRSVAIDREPEMLRAAEAAAREAGLSITFFETPIEEFACADNSFDFVTIGRALHWLPREATLLKLERIVAAGGRIAICGSAASASATNEWSVTFRRLRSQWSANPDESCYHVDLDEWFSSSRFRKIDEITVEHRHTLMVEELIQRALSFSTVSPAVLGNRRPQFEAELRFALEPFARAGVIEEELVVKGTIFG